MSGGGDDYYYGGDDDYSSRDDYYGDDTVAIAPKVPSAVPKVPAGNVCCEYESKCAGGRNLQANATTPTSGPIVESKEGDYYDDDSCEYVCLKYADHVDKC